MTEFLALFHFIRPWWFLALVPVILLTVLLWVSQKNSQQWQRFIAPHLLPHLLDTVQTKQKRWPLLALAALWFLCIVALAGPAWKKIPQPVEQDISALVICWDLSPSMLAEDVKPSRLVRSRLKIIDLLKSREEGQVALIAFSGEAYTVTPLTDDIQTIINLLPALSPTTLPTTGSNPEMALEQAQQLLKDTGILKGNILFITDEIDNNAFDFIENELSRSPHQLTFWGVGTKEGAPIPLPSGGFAKSRGNMVVAKLNEDALLSFSSKNGAYYIPMQTLGHDIKSINQLLSSSLQNQTKQTERVFDRWIEHGQYLCFLLLPFIAYFFRRGWVFTLVFFVVIPMTPTQSAYAVDWKDLWETQDQQAQKELDQGDETAVSRFSTHERRGSEFFKQGKFEESSQEFSQGETAADEYNKGNALTHNGNFDEAIEAFQKALEKDPSLTDAEDNLKIAQQLAELAKKQEQEQQGEDGEQKDDKNSEQQQSEQDQQKGDKNEQGDKSEQDDSQQQNSDQKQDGSEESSDSSSEPQQSSDEANPEDNPFSKENTEQQKTEEEQKKSEQEKAEEEKSELAQKEDRKEEKEEQQLTEQQAKQLAQAQQMTDEEKEQQQKLETWLRKVPDDPSGLMRNKFQYEYNKRRQGIQSAPSYSNDDPEERW